MMEILLIILLIVSSVNLIFCILISNFLIKHGDQTKAIQVDAEILKDGMIALMKQVSMRPTSGLMDTNIDRQ